MLVNVSLTFSVWTDWYIHEKCEFTSKCIYYLLFDSITDTMSWNSKCSVNIRISRMHMHSKQSKMRRLMLCFIMGLRQNRLRCNTTELSKEYLFHRIEMNESNFDFVWWYSLNVQVSSIYWIYTSSNVYKIWTKSLHKLININKIIVCLGSELSSLSQDAFEWTLNKIDYNDYEKISILISERTNFIFDRGKNPIAKKNFLRDGQKSF